MQNALLKLLKERLVFGGVFLCIFYVNYNNINMQIKGMRKNNYLHA